VDDFTAPKNVQEDNNPLSQRDLGDMFGNQVPEPQIIARIQQKGVSFDVSQQMVDTMRQRGVSDAVIKALQAAPKKEAQPSTSPYKKQMDQVKGDPDTGFTQAEVVSEGTYGCPVITHCCLESHGSVSEWTDDDHLFSHLSTQNVSGLAAQFSQAL